MILVTGGAGFIGSNFVLDWLKTEADPVLTLDKLTYAGNLGNLASIANNAKHRLVQGDIANLELLNHLLQEHQPRAIVHFAAESHVDRSIHGPGAFVQTNIVGTFQLLEATKTYWQKLPTAEQTKFRFVHVSTDEVYGSLTASDPAFAETTPYAPNSPYSASKAASDHLVRAYHHTYGLPTLTTNCSNNYGPRQFPEKLIPVIIQNALAGKPIPIYGDGQNIRDWLYVGDHCQAIRTVLAAGKIGETYNIGGEAEMKNLEVVETICAILAEFRPGTNYRQLINFVSDRPGHDRRYAMNIEKIQRDLGWKPQESFSSGIRKTVSWYLENQAWVNAITSGEYQQWVRLNYANRQANN